MEHAIFILGEAPENLTNLEYYPVINKPINTTSALHEILHKSSLASEEVGQSYVIITVDQGVYYELICIIWTYPRLCKLFIILLGGFHINKCYLSRLGHKIAHSGFGDVLLEANLTTGGTLKGILACSGKLYNKTLYIYKVVMEALQRLLFYEFLKLHPEENEEVFVTLKN